VLAPPLRFDWRRTYVWAHSGDTPTRTQIVYTSQPNPSVALQAWSPHGASWLWIALDVRSKVVFRRGSAGSLGRAKQAAELAVPDVDAPRQTAIEWTEIGDRTESDLPF
jgi:hypothetical protein